MKQLILPPRRNSASSCFACGQDNPKGLHLKFYLKDDRTVTTDLVPPPEWCGWENLMHGGLQCVLLDEITAWAVTALAGREYFLTAGLDVKYRKPVRLDQKLTLIGRLLESSDRASRVHGQILGENGDVLSEATARVVHVDEARFQKILETLP